MFAQSHLHSEERYERGSPELHSEYVPPMNHDAAHDILYKANAILQSSQNQLDDIKNSYGRSDGHRLSRESVEEYLEGVNDTIYDRNKRFFDLADVLASAAPLPSPSGSQELDEAELMIAPLLKGIPTALPSLYDPQFIMQHAQYTLNQKNMIRRRGPGRIKQLLMYGTAIGAFCFTALLLLPLETLTTVVSAPMSVRPSSPFSQPMTMAPTITVPIMTKLISYLGGSGQIAFKIAGSTLVMAENIEKAFRYGDYKYVTQGLLQQLVKQGIVVLPVFAVAFITVPGWLALGGVTMVFIQMSLNCVTMMISPTVDAMLLYRSDEEMQDLMYNQLAQAELDKIAKMDRLIREYNNMARHGFPKDEDKAKGMWALFDVKNGLGSYNLISNGQNVIKRYGVQFFVATVAAMLAKYSQQSLLGDRGLSQLLLDLFGVTDTLKRGAKIGWQLVIMPQILRLVSFMVVGITVQATKIEILRRVGATKLSDIPGLGRLFKAIERQLHYRITFNITVGAISSFLFEQMTATYVSQKLRGIDIFDDRMWQNMGIYLTRMSNTIQEIYQTKSFDKLANLFPPDFFDIHQPKNGDFLYKFYLGDYTKTHKVQEHVIDDTKAMYAVPLSDAGEILPFDLATAVEITPTIQKLKNLYLWDEKLEKYVSADMVTGFIGFLKEGMVAGPIHPDGKSSLLTTGDNLLLNAVKAGADPAELGRRTKNIWKMEKNSECIRKSI